jgi:DTW domain-containing protein YfiP
MRTTTAQAAQLLLFSGAVHALPEVSITKHRHADVNPARLRRRQTGDTGGTVETNTYDVLTWSTGGAYYANGKLLRL